MIYPYEFILIRWKTFYSSMSKIFDTITLYFVHFFEFIKRRIKIFTIDTEIDTDEIKVLLDENPYLMAWDIADDLQISHIDVLNHIHQIGYISRLDAWVSHALTEAQPASRTEICDSLIRREKNHPFLKSLVTGDKRNGLSTIIWKEKDYGKSFWSTKCNP